MTETRPVWAGF